MLRFSRGQRGRSDSHAARVLAGVGDQPGSPRVGRATRRGGRLPAREVGLLAADCCVLRVSPAWRRPPGRPGPAGVRQIGEVRLPILSVVSSGTLVPFRKRLSRLNQAIMATYLRVVITPKVSSSAVSVSSVRVWAWESSSVARQISTYSGSTPDTEPSEAAAEISAWLSPALPASVVFACHS